MPCPFGRGCLVFALCLLAVGSLDCFPDAWRLNYYDCCRDVQERTGLPFMSHQCFDQDYTWQACCTFPFGPRIRGLGHKCHRDPGGIAQLSLGSAGLIGIRCRPYTPTQEPREIWIHSYLGGRLLADLGSILKGEAGKTGKLAWPEGLEAVTPLLSLRRPLRVLDISCGLGLLSIAAARVGHNVTAVDNDPWSLALARRNARRNGVRVNVQSWDFRAPPSEDILSHGPFDVVYSEPGTLIMSDYSANPEQKMQDLHRLLTQGLEELVKLNASLYLFVGSYNPYEKIFQGTGAISLADAALMFGLANLGQRPEYKRPCTKVCKAREPAIAPRHWIASKGLGPPTEHAFIVW